MADADGTLAQGDIDKLNAFLGDHCGQDEALTCPVTGARVPIKDWNAPDRILRLPAAQGSYDAVALTSPAGGVILISVVKLDL